MLKDSTITIPILAEEIGISTTAVENHISRLQRQGLVSHVELDKGEYWLVNGT